MTTPPRRGCSVLPWLVLAVWCWLILVALAAIVIAMLYLAAPRAAANQSPTGALSRTADPGTGSPLLGAPQLVLPDAAVSQVAENTGPRPAPSGGRARPAGHAAVDPAPDGALTPQPEAAVPPSGETPSPSSDVGMATWTASATWCAPRGGQCTRWGGDALLAALPTFRWGDEPYLVRVTRGSASVVVAVVSQCWCGVDLSPHAFRQLAPLSRGRIDVEVEDLRGIVLPQTSMEETP